MRRWLMCLAGAVGIATLGGNSDAQVIGDPLKICQFTFSSGGATGLVWCLNANGAIYKLESEFDEHIQIGVVSEGYALCDWRTDRTAYDYGGSVSSGFTATTIVSGCLNGALPCTLQRETTDGLFRLRMAYNHNVSEREITITATVTNLDSVTSDTVELWRFADVDVDETAQFDVADRSRRSAWAGEGSRVGLTALTRASDIVPFTFITGFSPPSTPNLCSEDIADDDIDVLPFRGDVGLVTGYQIQSGIKARKSKAVKFQYRID